MSNPPAQERGLIDECGKKRATPGRSSDAASAEKHKKALIATAG